MLGFKGVFYQLVVVFTLVLVLHALAKRTFNPLTPMSDQDRISLYNNIQIQPSLKAELAFFFSRTSQGQNALPRPGLEPGSSDSKPSALTIGLPNKAVALMCPRYSRPRVLKVAPCTVVRSYIQIFSARWVTTILYNYGLRSASAAINTISTR